MHKFTFGAYLRHTCAVDCRTLFKHLCNSFLPLRRNTTTNFDEESTEQVLTFIEQLCLDWSKASLDLAGVVYGLRGELLALDGQMDGWIFPWKIRFASYRFFLISGAVMARDIYAQHWLVNQQHPFLRQQIWPLLPTPWSLTIVMQLAWSCFWKVSWKNTLFKIQQWGCCWEPIIRLMQPQ